MNAQAKDYPGKTWLSMWAAGQYPTEADFEAVRDCGAVDGFEIWTEHPEALWEVEMAAKAGLEVGIHLPFHDLNPVSDDVKVVDRAMERNKEWLHDLHKHGGIHAVLHGGYAFDAADRDDAIERFKVFVAELDSEAKALGIELLLENLIPDKLNFLHIIGSSLSEWQELLDATGCGGVLDTSHSAATAFSLQEAFETLGTQIRAIHLSDNDEKADLHLLPGDGHDVTADLKQILTDIQYDGVVTYEITPNKYTFAHVLDHIVANPV